jgi:hypothetical protein
MLEIGQKVIVITDKGIAYDATILARAKGDDGPGAYNVSMQGLDPEQPGQWHKACDVFIPEKTAEQEEQESLDSFIKE